REKGGLFQGHSPTDPPPGAASRAEGVENASDEYGLFMAYVTANLCFLVLPLPFWIAMKSHGIALRRAEEGLLKPLKEGNHYRVLQK
ncbi:hypothetical protein DV515_00003754, partial [Chloebia gouldiae]